MDSTIKSLVITGAAAEDATRSRLKGTATTRKRRQMNDDEEFIEKAKQLSTRPVINLTQPVAPVASISPMTSSMSPVASMSPVTSMSPMISSVHRPLTSSVQQVQNLKPIHFTSHSHNVNTESNVILKPPRVQRVKLQPKVAHSHGHIQEKEKEPENTTRKARRIHLNSGNLAHRFTRARRVKEDTEKKPVGSIREYLVSKGVIQQKSKAPEKMLRSMYSDFMLLKDQAL